MLRSNLGVFVLMAACLTSVTCNAQIEKTIENAAKSSHLLLPTPPLGFQVSRTPLVVKEKFIGFNTVLQREGFVTKVLIRVDLNAEADFTKRGWRSGLAKGAINGFIGSVVESGFTVKDVSLPELEGNDLTEELRVKVEFEKENGDQLFSNQRIFFDTRGFSIMVIATDKQELETLLKWADQITPVDIPKIPTETGSATEEGSAEKAGSAKKKGQD